VLNAPEVGILGVGTIVNAPIETPEGIGIEKRMGLSLTIDHQAVDGAPGARFLKDLSALLANLEWAAAL
jgi:pyruvate dehydrogenase E2 component (dihydrolipoamide acetyltransferase)